MDCRRFKETSQWANSSKSSGDSVLGGDLEGGEGYVDRFERLGDELDIGVG